MQGTVANSYVIAALTSDAARRSGRAAQAFTNTDYRVEKMKYDKRGKDKDPPTLIYDTKITITGVPLVA